MIADDVAEALWRYEGEGELFYLDAHFALSEATVEAGDPGFTRYEFADGSAIVVFEGVWGIGVPVSRLEAAQRALLAEAPDLRPDMARFLPEDQIGTGGPGRSAQ